MNGGRRVDDEQHPAPLGEFVNVLTASAKTPLWLPAKQIRPGVWVDTEGQRVANVRWWLPLPPGFDPPV